MIDGLRRALFRGITDDKQLARMIEKTMAGIKAKKDGLVYISPLNIMVDQDGHLYWVEKTNTYRLRSISKAPLEERMDSLWGRKPEIKDVSEEQ